MNLKHTLLATTATLLLAASQTLTAADVAENWTKHCGSCHGADGTAKTKAGRMAGAKDLTDAAYQKQFTDDQILQRLKDGVSDKGKEKMKPFKGTLTDDELKALVAKVRTFAK
ncbi:MAG: cytochrome c [Verrucomicrobia bacterium]|nr:cytochrome c [Verrucomicrobiota bacterium]NBU07555.1 cytochrome c [Pseudomonadota bacterium]NDA67836.1 cytochrome c [Verrucomicrobiota bacterium]NDB75670.1 cytochrome c [Verrucomicrobiota bacterium]NDD38702.1 cytochrome c [Verrucomicrobiota bacterium]